MRDMPPAYGLINTDELATSLGTFFGILTQHRFILYLMLVFYYEKFHRWPASRKELEEYLLSAKDMTEDEDASIKKIFRSSDKDAPKPLGQSFKNAEDVLRFAPFECTVLKNGDLLIEGRLDEKLEKAMAGSSLGKCCFSIICHASEEGYTFRASPESKNNRDYFNLPATVKKPAAAQGK